MSRYEKPVEFLQTLQEMSGLNARQFAKACGMKQPNMNNILNGKHVPKLSTVPKAAAHYFAWPVKKLFDLKPLPDNLNELPNSPGLYALYDSGGNLLYVGKAMKLRREVSQTLDRKIPVSIRLERGGHLKTMKPKFRQLTRYLSLYEIPDARVRHNLESLILRFVTNQTHNSNIGRFK